jgi:signal transduction histidine kinase
MKKRLLFIVIAFSVSFVLMVSLSLFSIERFITYISYSDKVAHTNKVIAALYKTEVALKDLDRAERGYILTHDTAYLRFVNISVDSMRPALQQVETLLSQDLEQDKNIALLKSNVALRVNYSRADIAYVDSSTSSALSSYYFDGRKTMRETILKLRAMHRTENELLDERFRNQKIYQKLTSTTLKYLIAIFCIVTFFLFIFMIREFRQRVKYQDELQARVNDLRRSHNELQEIAYAASHDLQEPLRKIQVFSNMLLYRTKSTTAESGEELVSRITDSAERMQVLITDLMSLTSLTNIDEEKKDVDLGDVLQHLLTDMNAQIRSKNADVSVGQLPIVCGYKNQLFVLFKALLDNALKFSREGVKPEIKIFCEETDGQELADTDPLLAGKRFYRVVVRDNGIGFENKFITKMFKIFQQLHTEQSGYGGKGIGLAICQRVMVNHEGYMVANGVPGEGAAFKLYFPAPKR